MDAFQAFCQRYTQDFLAGGKRQIGVEKEILVTDASGNMARLTERVWPKLKSLGWEPRFDTFYKDEVTGFFKDGTEITTDAGLGTFEVIFEPKNTVAECEVAMKKVLQILLPFCGEEGYKVLGLGYQPLAEEKAEYWNRKQRYEILESTFGQAVRPSLLGAADQAHIDITADEFVPVTNALGSAAGFLMTLFSNSPVREGKVSQPQINREMFWDDLGMDRTGIPDRPWESMEEYLSACWDLPFVMAKGEDGKYFNSGATFREFTKDMSEEELFKQFCIHEGCIWFCARPRVFGTIEVRPICTQPWEDMLLPAAAILGLVENWRELEEFLKDFSWEERRQLRYDSAEKGFGTVIQGRPIAEFLKDFVGVIQRGLDQCGDPASLDALRQRIADQQAPSDRAIAYFEEGGVPLMVEKVSLKPEHLLF